MRGKATGSSCVKLNSQDHPRVCGEKPERKAPRRPRLGSPPRMRGKETDSRRQCCSAGITPAYAGKSIVHLPFVLRVGDHPRVCGEKGRTGALDVVQRGSPPRMRGKVRELLFSFHCARITPAYAGKSGEQSPAWRVLQDHPRVCGEKAVVSGFVNWSWGSPPRMRGKAGDLVHVETESGITPAYAGKS